jgi:hypothetical protein
MAGVTCSGLMVEKAGRPEVSSSGLDVVMGVLG